MKNKKDYPLSFVRIINRTLNQSHQWENEYREFVRFEEIERDKISLVDRDPTSTFFLTLKNPQPKDGKVLYEVELKPTNSEVLTPKKFVAFSESLELVIKNWVNVIKNFNLESWKDENSIIDGYEKEYYDPIRLDEEDADTTSFDQNKQEIIRAYLQHSIRLLEEKGLEENKELIEDAQEIHDNVTRLTKNEILKGLARFWGKARYRGLEFVKDLFKEGYAMGLQKIISIGAGEVMDIFTGG